LSRAEELPPKPINANNPNIISSRAEIEIVAIILDWFTRHKDYGRKFGYE